MKSRLMKVSSINDCVRILTAHEDDYVLPYISDTQKIIVDLFFCLDVRHFIAIQIFPYMTNAHM